MSFEQYIKDTIKSDPIDLSGKDQTWNKVLENRTPKTSFVWGRFALALFSFVAIIVLANILLFSPNGSNSGRTPNTNISSSTANSNQSQTQSKNSSNGNSASTNTSVNNQGFQQISQEINEITALIQTDISSLNIENSFEDFDL